MFTLPVCSNGNILQNYNITTSILTYSIHLIEICPALFVFLCVHTLGWIQFYHMKVPILNKTEKWQGFFTLPFYNITCILPDTPLLVLNHQQTLICSLFLKFLSFQKFIYLLLEKLSRHLFSIPLIKYN